MLKQRGRFWRRLGTQISPLVSPDTWAEIFKTLYPELIGLVMPSIGVLCGDQKENFT